MNNHHHYIRRTFDLARRGSGYVAPNPMVGAVLVYRDKIIGEGFHQKYGTAHAEVNCLKSVAEEDRHLIAESTLFVSLEPCCIFGKTPPCTNLILKHKIPKVVISCLDLTPDVAGNGVKILRDAGVEVVTGILEEEGLWLSRHRQTFVTKNRPYITLKWAQTIDGFIARSGEQTKITNEVTNRYVHHLRSQYSAILVGSRTAKIDNPRLNNRLALGPSPLRVVLNKAGDLPENLHLLTDGLSTWYVTENKRLKVAESVKVKNIPFDNRVLENLMTALATAKYSSLLVEGGSETLQNFIKNQLWDEAQILTNHSILKNGVKAPVIFGQTHQKKDFCGDELVVKVNPNNIK